MKITHIVNSKHYPFWGMNYFSRINSVIEVLKFGIHCTNFHELYSIVKIEFGRYATFANLAINMQIQMPKISVIIPTYNRAELLKPTLDSVLQQSFKDFEIIVVDDGSTDQTEQLLLSYKGKINCFKIENSGQSYATNYGIHHAKGEYIALLDSDDLWDENFLQTSINVLIANGSYDFCYCNYSYFDEDKIISEKYLPEDKQISGNLFSKVLEGTFVCTGSYLIKKSDIIQIGLFDTSLPVVSDWDIWLRISYHLKGVYIDESLFKLRQHSNRISNNSLPMAVGNLRVIRKIKKLFPDEYEKHKTMLYKKLAKNHRVVGSSYRMKGQFLNSINHYMKSFWYSLLTKETSKT